MRCTIIGGNQLFVIVCPWRLQIFKNRLVFSVASFFRTLMIPYSQKSLERLLMDLLYILRTALNHKKGFASHVKTSTTTFWLLENWNLFKILEKLKDFCRVLKFPALYSHLFSHGEKYRKFQNPTKIEGLKVVLISFFPSKMLYKI